MITNTFKISTETGFYDEKIELTEEEQDRIIEVIHPMINPIPEDEIEFTCEIHNGTSLYIDVLNNNDPEISTGDFYHNVFWA